MTSGTLAWLIRLVHQAVCAGAGGLWGHGRHSRLGGNKAPPPPAWLLAGCLTPGQVTDHLGSGTQGRGHVMSYGTGAGVLWTVSTPTPAAGLPLCGEPAPTLPSCDTGMGVLFRGSLCAAPGCDLKTNMLH